MLTGLCSEDKRRGLPEMALARKASDPALVG
jgi:hypothetical protein